jgi:hypothetical protein
VLQENTQLVSPPDRSSPEDVDVAVADFQSEDDVDPFGVTAQSTWKKCTASTVGACAFRNRVGFQNLATGADLRLQAARSYSLIRPPRTDRRLICCRSRRGAG